MCKVGCCHCLSHRDSVHAGTKVPRMTLIAERPHKKNGNAIFVRDDLKVKNVSIRDDGNVELITVSYLVWWCKPPAERFVLPAVGYRNLPHIVIGDFNSHITTWGYTTTDNNGEAVEHWAEANNQQSSTMQNYRNISTANDEKGIQSRPHLCFE